MTLSNFIRKDSESFDEYCYRISSLKDENGLTWEDIADIINKEFKVLFSESYYRKKYKRALKPSYIFERDMDLSDFEEEKYKIRQSDERVQINAALRRLSREDTIKEIAHEAAERALLIKPLPNYRQIKNNNSDKEALLLISDWHYGIEINNNFNIFNTDIARERVSELLSKTISKCDDMKISTLHIANLGDMIAGNIHLPLRLNSRIDVITQIMEVSEILCEFINNLSMKYNIKYYSVIDNHSRINPKKKESIQLESLCRITDWYIKERLPHIDFSEQSFGTDICIADILNYRVGFVHGHKDSPASVINKLNNFTETHLDLICSAHYHHFSANEDCGTILISNGSLMGTDEFAFDLRLHSVPSQTLIEISKDSVTECIYKINLD